MPLRMRLIALIGLLLLGSVGGGGMLVGWRAANSVRTELRAALDVGANTVRNALDGLAHTDDQVGALRHLVSTFNGNRHVRASLVDARDEPISVSALFGPTPAVPRWFRDLIHDEPGAVRLAVPDAGHGAGAIVLQADARNEVGEVWAESRDAVLVLAGFAVLIALLTYAVVGRALLPLENLSWAFGQIGEGHYHARLREHGPPELARLAKGFNAMTGQLAEAATQNRRLHERLLTLQAEERADLARDLHDEIGPLLFAVDMTVATIGRLAGGDRDSDIPTHVRLVQDAVSRMQRHIRVLLGRLRPVEASGLAVAIDRLVTFWRGQQPQIAFVTTISVAESRLSDSLRETIYRVIQEGMSNAIRHGKPDRLEIAIRVDDNAGIRVEVTDDGAGMAVDCTTRRDPSSLGLIGMRERVMATGGTLTIQHGYRGRGLTLVAELPCASSPRSRNVDGIQ